MINFIILIAVLRVSFVFTGFRYDWTSADFDRYTAWGRGLPMAVGSWLLACCFGHHASWNIQIRLILIGSISIVLRLLGCALAPNGSIFFAMGGFNVLGGVMSPLLRSSLSESASEANQGLLLTGIAAIETISGIWGPLAFGFIYSKTETINPSIIMYIFAGLGTFSVLVSGCLWLGEGELRAVARQ